jgi:SAM-dependent methyltransferase
VSSPQVAAGRLVLEEGASAHYRDPAYYTKCYAARRDDVAYYVETACAHAQEVLEYGCGNGRITLPIVERGICVTGVDQSRFMLDDLTKKLERKPEEVRRRVRLVQGDMRELRLRRRFGLVLCTFNTFLHLYVRDDVERFLARVRSHLRPDGRFVFDVSMPDPAELARNPARAYCVPSLRHPTTGQLVRYSERFDYRPADQVLRVTMRFEPIDAPQQAWTTLLTHRQFHPLELEALLHYNGFVVDAVHSDFTRVPLEDFSDAAVWTVRPAGRRGRSAHR